MYFLTEGKEENNEGSRGSTWVLAVHFPKKLVKFRKNKGWADIF